MTKRHERRMMAYWHWCSKGGTVHATTEANRQAYNEWKDRMDFEGFDPDRIPVGFGGVLVLVVFVVCVAGCWSITAAY